MLKQHWLKFNIQHTHTMNATVSEVTVGEQIWKQEAGRLYVVSGVHIDTVTRTPPEVGSTRPDSYSPGSTAPALWQLNLKKEKNDQDLFLGVCMMWLK